MDTLCAFFHALSHLKPTEMFITNPVSQVLRDTYIYI